MQSLLEYADGESLNNKVREGLVFRSTEKFNGEMAAVSTDFVKLNQLTAEKEETEKLLEEKMDRWMYLEELAARIAEQY